MKLFFSTKQVFFLSIFLFILFGWLSAHRPTLSYGDPLSDANTWVAGDNYVLKGFEYALGLPVFNERGASSFCKDRPCAYTHYPAFPYWVNGALKNFGFRDLAAHRIFLLTLTALGILFFFLFLRQILPGLNAVHFGFLSVLLHPEFWRYSDSLHQFSYNWFILTFVSWAWVFHLRTGLIRYFLLVILGFLLSTWVSFDYFVMIPATLWILQLHLQKRWYSHQLLILSAVPMLTLAVRIVQQGYFFSDLRLAFQDLFHAAGVRSQISFGDFLERTQSKLSQFHLVFLFFCLLSLPDLFRSFRARWKLGRVHSRNSLTLMPKVSKDQAQYILTSFLSTPGGLWFGIFLATLSWAVLMKQHFVWHHHTGHQYLFEYGLLMAVAFSKFNPTKWKIALIVLVQLIFFSNAPQINRWIPLNQREHQFISQVENLMHDVQVLREQEIAHEIWGVQDDLAHYVAVSSIQFLLVEGQNLCKIPGLRYYLVSLSDGIPVDCSGSFEIVRRWDHGVGLLRMGPRS